jgi:hypothetical protein
VGIVADPSGRDAWSVRASGVDRRDVRQPDAHAAVTALTSRIGGATWPSDRMPWPPRAGLEEWWFARSTTVTIDPRLLRNGGEQSAEASAHDHDTRSLGIARLLSVPGPASATASSPKPPRADAAETQGRAGASACSGITRPHARGASGLLAREVNSFVSDAQRGTIPAALKQRPDRAGSGRSPSAGHWEGVSSARVPRPPPP